MLQDRVPASFTEIAPRSGTITIAAIPSAQLVERRRLAIEGSGLSVSEYRLASDSDAVLEERQFLDRALGTDIFAVTLARLSLKAGDEIGRDSGRERVCPFV